MTDNSQVDIAITKKAHAFIAVPTKAYDGGTISDSETASKRSRKPFCELEDRFMYYSDQKTRMNALHFTNSQKGELAAADYENVVRKTRISFELHPLLLFGDIYSLLDDARADDDDGKKNLDKLAEEILRLIGTKQIKSPTSSDADAAWILLMCALEASYHIVPKTRLSGSFHKSILVNITQTIYS